jgi:hypothetical protein
MDERRLRLTGKYRGRAFLRGGLFAECAIDQGRSRSGNLQGPGRSMIDAPQFKNLEVKLGIYRAYVGK